jgi:hypothetical protein
MRGTSLISLMSADLVLFFPEQVINGSPQSAFIMDEWTTLAMAAGKSGFPLCDTLASMMGAGDEGDCTVVVVPDAIASNLATN